MSWMGDTGKIFTTGFSKSDRQMAVWDTRDLSKAIKIKRVDNDTNMLFPYFDPANNVAYLSTRGGGSISVVEYVDEHEEKFFMLPSFGAKEETLGFCFMPKRYIDPKNTELQRGVRLTKTQVEYIAFRLPRTQGAFVPTFYAPCPSGEPAMTAEEYLKGENKAAPKVEMKGDMSDVQTVRIWTGEGVEVAAPRARPEEAKAAAPAAPRDNGGAEVEEMQRQIAQLKEQLAESNAENAALRKAAADAAAAPAPAPAAEAAAGSNEEVETLKGELERVKRDYYRALTVLNTTKYDLFVAHGGNE